MKTLAKLKPGQSAHVAQVHGTGALPLRLMEMGFTRGVVVTLRKTAPLGDPLHVQLRGYSLSLRRADAALVELL